MGDVGERERGGEREREREVYIAIGLLSFLS
jgi:hypothetical protein